MGRFHGSPAEDLTAEAMIHGWEAICKLWEASSVLDSCDLDGPAIDTADKTVQQHLRDAIKLFETALDKFSCKIVYDIVGHAYNPILHELDRSDPEVEAFRGSIGSLSGAVLSDFLCGAAVATVVRPGLEVTGIMRARPRVWVTLLSSGGIRTCQTGINPVPAQHQQQLRFAPFASKAPVLGAKALLTGQARKLDASGASDGAVRIEYLNASAGADIVALHSEEQSAPTVLISGHTVSQPVTLPAARPACGTSAGVSEYSTAQRGDQQQQHGAEERTGCAAMQGKNHPVYVTTAPVADGVMPILSSPSPLPAASAAASFAGAGPKGPLQLLLALRAGRRTGAVAVHATTTTTDIKEKTACSVRTGLDPGTGDPARSGLASAVAGGGGQKTNKRGGGSSPAIKESASGRFRKGTGTADTGGPRCGAPGSHDDGSLGGDSQRRRVGSDDVDNNDDGGHDDVCYQQYDTSTHHPATQPRVATGTAVQQSQTPQRRLLQHAQRRAATALVATVVSSPGECSAPPTATVPRQAAAICGRTSTGGIGQAGTVLSSSERPTSAWPDGRCNPAGPIPGPSLDRFEPTATAAPAPAVPTGAFSGGGIEAIKDIMPICSTDSVSLHGAKDINETSGSAVGSDRTSTNMSSAAGAATTRWDDNGGNGGSFNPARSAAAAGAAAASCGVPSSAALAAAAAVRAAVAAAAAANSRAGISSSTALPLTTPRTSAVRATPQPPPPPHATVIVNSDGRAGSDGGTAADAAAALTSFAPAAPGLPSSPESKTESGVEPGAPAGGTSGRPRMEAPPRRMPTPGGGTLAAGKITVDAIAPVAAAATATTCSGPGTYRDGPGDHASGQSHQGSRQQSGTRIAQVARRGHSSAGVEVELGDEDLETSRSTLASPLTGHIQKPTSRSSAAALPVAAAAQPPQQQHLCPRKQQSSHTSVASTTAAANTNAVSEPSRASCSSDCGTGHGERASQDRVELDAVAAVTTGAADGGGSDVALGQQRHVGRGRRRGIGPGLWQPLAPPASQQQQQQRHQGQYHDGQPRRLQQQQQERHMGRTDRASQLNQVHQREHYERHPPSDAPGVIGKVPAARPQSADSMARASKPGGGCGRRSGGAAASSATLLVEESPEEASGLTARGVGGAGACGGDDAGGEDEEQVEGEEHGDVRGL
ncbi:hypothetical protein Vretifemale_3619, partial [Volvox reticuliferus]